MIVQPENLIPVGRIAGTHGIRGQVRLFSYSGNLESLKAADAVVLKRPDGTHVSIRLIRVAPHCGKLLLTLDGIDSIEKAEPVIGSELCLTRDQFPPTEENEYYWCDLLGLKVSTDSGLELGVITDILETGANDVYVVNGNGKEHLIPAIASVICKVDLEGGSMIITPLEGMLDL